MIRFVLVILFFNPFNILGQENIKYRPNSLQRELAKEKIDELSEINISDAQLFQTEIMGKFFLVKNINLQNGITYVYVGRVNSCRSGGCSLTNETVSSTFEYFDYFILYNTEGRVINVKVFNYMATKGQEITARSWLKQFNGYEGRSALQVGEDIDGISGATISVYAIINDVQAKTQLLHKWIRQKSKAAFNR